MKKNSVTAHRLRTLSYLIGAVMTVSTYIILLAIFVIAYLSPDKAVLVTINTFGEADFERVLLLVTVLPVAFFLREAILSVLSRARGE